MAYAKNPYTKEMLDKVFSVLNKRYHCPESYMADFLKSGDTDTLPGPVRRVVRTVDADDVVEELLKAYFDGPQTSYVKDQEIKDSLFGIRDVLVEKGYNPVDQPIGYLRTGDDHYIPSKARPLTYHLDRYEVFKELYASYMAS